MNILITVGIVLLSILCIPVILLAQGIAVVIGFIWYCCSAIKEIVEDSK